MTAAGWAGASRDAPARPADTRTTMANQLELYLIRHGAAAAGGAAFPDDAKRPLTERGVASLRKEGRGLARLGVSFDVILTSPFVRARQTADILAAELPSPPPVVTTEALAPGGTFPALLDELANHARRRRFALIGHEPGLGELAARLIGLRQPLPFKKGGVCRIDFPGPPISPPGTLRWLLAPGLLRKLRK